MPYPRITIITPSFNQGNYIEETICSVLEQNYPDVEFIIIDGGSTDKTLDVIRKYSKYLSYWVSEKDRGQSHAINKGIKVATGEIINWLGSDDYLEKHALFAVANAFNNDENIHVVSGKFRLFNVQTGYEEIFDGTRLFDTLPATIVKSFLQQPSTFFRTRFFKEFGVSEQLHWYMCYELWVKYLIKYGQEHFRKTDHLIAHYRLHGESKTESQSQTSLEKDNKYLIDRNSIMHSLALKAGLTDKLATIKQLSDKILEDYEINIEIEGKEKLIAEVVNYYLFSMALRYFYETDRQQAYLLLKSINKKLLPKNEQRDFSYLVRKYMMDKVRKFFGLKTAL